ncbi:26682_t:CDS:2, partial [Dentiscutata erythropus]
MEVLEILSAADELLLTNLLEAILSEELEDDIVRCHLKLGSKPKLGTDLPRNNSVLITHQQKLRITQWIDRNRLEDAKISNVSNDKYAITLNDESYGPCFGDKDLWMR